jgi:Tol biopolymer transport system component
MRTLSIEAGRTTVDLERGSVTPVNTEGRSAWNIWSRDGRRVVFNSVRPDSPGTPLFWQVQDGSAPAERLTTTELMQQPRFFTSDGSVLVYQELHPDTGYDIWTLPMKSGAAPRPLLRTPFNEYQPSLSPDGRWLAYVSNESGRDELWVRSFPAMDQRVKVSSEGGGEPSWSPDGRELLYTTSHNPSVGSRLMAVEVNTKEGFRPGAPRTLVEGPYSIQPLYGQSYDISRDGTRFLMLKIDPLKSPTHISVVLNWFEELKRRAPIGTH